MSTTKYTGWQIIPTIQSKEILTELLEAKEYQRAVMIINDTGLSKTETVKLFQQKKPKHTFVFTLGDSYNLNSLLNEVCVTLGLPPYSTGTKNLKYLALRKITETLNEMGKEGSPVIIFDEAENAKIPTLKAVKEIYDAVIKNCSIVLIGTEQLIWQLNKKSNGQSVPQLRRRFKAGTRFITPFNKARDMKPFFELYIPKELDLQDLLIEICDNYGELHDYLDPVLRYCDKKNIPVTESIFRLYHKIPKRK